MMKIKYAHLSHVAMAIMPIDAAYTSNDARKYSSCLFVSARHRPTFAIRFDDEGHEYIAAMFYSYKERPMFLLLLRLAPAAERAPPVFWLRSGEAWNLHAGYHFQEIQNESGDCTGNI